MKTIYFIYITDELSQGWLSYNYSGTRYELTDFSQAKMFQGTPDNMIKNIKERNPLAEVLIAPFTFTEKEVMRAARLQSLGI